MKLGVFVYMEDDLLSEFAKVTEMGFSYCQLSCWERGKFTPSFVAKVKEAVARTGVEITSFWCGWEGPGEWNFYGGPETLGLAPKAYRMARFDGLIAGSDFARQIGVSEFITHVGFIPENPNNPDYWGLVYLLRSLAERCGQNGQNFLFETGQETPVTLLRTIEDVGRHNVGINLDPANLLMYGKANPLDAMDVFGRYVRAVHAKDGEYPTDGKNLGVEKALGEGRVDFPALIRKLKDHGFDGPVIIERETGGDRTWNDILAAKRILERLIG